MVTTGDHFSIFTKDEFYYCVQIENVREVIRTPNLILAPVNTVGFMGFLDFRKTLCPVLDILSIIRNEQEVHEDETFLLMVLECDSCLFAILIDRFIESLRLEDQTQEDDSDSSSDLHKQLIDQVYRYSGNALNRINLQFLRSFVQENIKDHLTQQAALQHADEVVVDPNEEIEMICFGIDHLRFGIPITDLVEVIEGYSVEPLFRTNIFLRGLINLRGQIIACVDISEAIGLTRRKMEERNQYILLQDNERDLALCIDSISKKQKFLRNQVLNVEHIFSGELADYLLGIIEMGQDRIFVISGPKIFASKYLVSYQE